MTPAGKVVAMNRRMAFGRREPHRLRIGRNPRSRRAFTIANVIRLTMILYREEIEIMRLVGATERIIRGPFFIEGLLHGTIGGIIAVALLFVLFEATRRTLVPSSTLLWGFLFSCLATRRFRES